VIQGVVIAMVVVLVVRDGFPGFPLVPTESPLTAALLAVGPQVAIALVLNMYLRVCAKRLDRTGRLRNVVRADRAVAFARFGALLVHASAVLGFGWLDAVRYWLGGNLVVVDEAVALLPALIPVVGGWWSFSMIDRRLREASLIRALDEGRPVHRAPSRWRYTLEQVRHNLVLVLVPLAVIAAWMESSDFLMVRFFADAPWLSGPWGTFAVSAVHLAGVALVLVLAPLVPRYLWDTVPLGDGPVRERLARLCREQGVRCRDILVWRTESGMLNGAVIGAVPWLRYILLTDALLEQLGDREVEAVMAHEVAHARRHHIPWLMVSLLAAVGGAWIAVSTGARWLSGSLGEDAGTLESGAIVTIALGLGLSAGLIVLGFVSRRFEQQADAFATQHLSGVRSIGPSPPDARIVPEAVDAMAGALGVVAAMNAIPVDRFTWRHGSIRGRQARLAALVGLPASPLPIDRTVRLLKLGAGLLLALVLVAALFDPSLGLF